MSFDIVGTDANGDALLETLTGANAGTATSAGSFLTIASITADGDPVGLVSAGGETFSKVSDWGQTTYFDSNGVILGYYDSWSDSYQEGSELHEHSGESYMDADWNHLGGSSSSYLNGVLMYSSSSIKVENLDGTSTETGTNSWLEGSTTMTSSFTFNFDANGNMTGGSEVRPDGTTVNLGADWTFLGEVIDVSGATLLTNTSGIPAALLSQKDDGITKFILKNHIMESGGTQGGTTGMHSGTSSTTTYVDSDGTILGFKDTWSDSYGIRVILHGCQLELARRSWI